MKMVFNMIIIVLESFRYVFTPVKCNFVMDVVNRILAPFDDFAIVREREYYDQVIYSISDLECVCRLSKNSFKSKSILMNVEPPLVVVGDMHGNITDLLNIFRLFGHPSKTIYLFLGDYVDRGANSVLIITLLLALLIKYPSNTHIIRGNHEFSVINRVFGFYDEVMTKYKNETVWTMFQDVFSFMPLGAIISNRIFCVHGGISPVLNSIDDIISIKRPIESYSDNQIVSDILWSDPIDSQELFIESRRGLGVRYSIDAVITFLKNNNLALMIRAHQCVMNGCNLFADMHGITTFSSSNYNPETPNKCGVVRIPSKSEIQMFSLDFTLPLHKQENACLFIEEGKTGLKIGERKQAEFDENGAFKTNKIASSKSAKTIKLKSVRKSSGDKEPKKTSSNEVESKKRHNSDGSSKVNKIKIPQMQKMNQIKPETKEDLAPAKRKTKIREIPAAKRQSADESLVIKSMGIKSYKSTADISHYIDVPKPPKKSTKNSSRRFSTIGVAPESLFEQALKECNPSVLVVGNLK